jgi:uncharacterized SAM-binding protein YcdF (DUF218 family)
MKYPAEWQGDVETISNFLADKQPIDQADAILVFGHYLPQVAEQAAALFHRGVAPVILVSGYYHEKIPAGYRSEAHHYAQLMISSGVPENAIILEENASNTLENVLFGIEKLTKAGHNIRSLVLVGVPWLMRRARATVAKQFPDIEIGTESFEPPLDMIDEIRVARLVGEVDRLIEYHAKGDLHCPIIPKNVRLATERLRQLIERRQTENKG